MLTYKKISSYIDVNSTSGSNGSSHVSHVNVKASYLYSRFHMTGIDAMCVKIKTDQHQLYLTKHVRYRFKHVMLPDSWASYPVASGQKVSQAWNWTWKHKLCFFTLGVSLFIGGCCFMHSDSNIQVPLIKDEQAAVLDSTWQTVLGGSLWYWILFIERAGVHHIDQANRHMHYLLRWPAAAVWHEHGGSLLIRKDSQCNFFF